MSQGQQCHPADGAVIDGCSQNLANVGETRFPLAAALIGLGLVLGCSPSEPVSSQPGRAAESERPEAGDPSAAPEISGEPQRTPSEPILNAEVLGGGTTGQGARPDTSPRGPSESPFPADPAGENPRALATLPVEQTAQPQPFSGRQLKPDLSPPRLMQFLADADQDLGIISSGRSGLADEETARAEMLRLIRLKLEASRRLASHPEATPKQASVGARGELQALSHLAALRDLAAATELEQLASRNLNAKDPDLAFDCRLVMIGFAIEALQNGDDPAPQRIVALIEGISGDRADVPSLMVMGQAREALQKYGHRTEARQIRERILNLFADSADPNVAEMAARVAGRVEYDRIEELRAAAVEGAALADEPWRQAVETLIAEAPDMQTVQYLASAALEFESLGSDSLVAVTFESLQRQFSDPASATHQEIQMAAAAYQARKEILGQPLDRDLDVVGGRSLSIDDYQGKVVLMPFWASGFPESLQLIPQLEKLQQQQPSKLAIVGMNLDPEGAPTTQFQQRNGLNFPSFHSVSTATSNRMAVKFGMVSMPFVAILDREGKVAGLNFTGRRLTEMVDAVLAADGAADATE